MTPPPSRSPLSRLIQAAGHGRARYLSAALIVFAASGLGLALHTVLREARVSMIFLAGVVIAAVTLGAGPAYFAAAIAFAIYDFYLSEPHYTFTFEPNALLTLSLFLILAGITGRLGGRLRDQQRAASERARLREQLLEASGDFAAAAHEDDIRRALASHMAAVAGQAAIVLEDDLVGDAPPPAVILAARASPPANLEGWSLHALSSGGQTLGVAAWRDRPEGLPGAERDQLIGLLIDLAAASLARARLADDFAQVQATAEAAKLRATLLSSLSHDLRTPLASILASAGGLRQFGDKLTGREREDMLAAIQEEAERLRLYVDNLLSMTRLESGAVIVQTQPLNLPEIVGRVLHRAKGRQGERVVATAGLAHTVMGDPMLLEQAFTNIVENAYRFSGPASRLDISATDKAGLVSIAFTDDGPGVPAADLDRIFEKFYRCASERAIPGTGLGLSITKGMIEAMGGSVRAEGNSARGLAIIIELAAA